jgi:hypothetical protein
MFEVTYTDEDGNEHVLSGGSVQELAEQLSEGERVDITVRDGAGFVRGWIHARDDWRAQVIRRYAPMPSGDSAATPLGLAACGVRRPAVRHTPGSWSQLVGARNEWQASNNWRKK